MSIAIHRAGSAVAGHAARHPITCVGEALIALTLLALVGWAATGAGDPILEVDRQVVTQQAAAPVAEDGRPDAPPSWVWDKRVSHDSMLYAFGVD